MLRFILVLSCALTAFGQLRQEEVHPAPEPYNFAFSSPNEDGTSSSREETGDANGRVTGSYTIQGADGQQRRVEYVADENGFRANVITNEIGTESQSTGDAQFQSSAPTAAELTAQWEASGAGKVRAQAVPVGAGISRVVSNANIAPVAPVVPIPDLPAVAPLPQPIARPISVSSQGLRSISRGFNRNIGLVSAPINPIVGGAVGAQNLRINQFGIRSPIAAPVAASFGSLGAPVPFPRGQALERNVAFSVPTISGVSAPKINAVQTEAVAPAIDVRALNGLQGLQGLNRFDLNRLNIGVTPLAFQHLNGPNGQNGLALRSLSDLGNNANIVLLSGAQLQPQHGSAEVDTGADRTVTFKSESGLVGRKY